MRATKLALVIAMLIATLPACGETKPIRTMTLTPKTATVSRGDHDEATYSCFPGTCVHTHGTGCNVDEGPGAVRVGYDYRHDEGTAPCNCWWWVSCAWRGAVTFDLSPLQGKGIVNAELFYTQSDQRSAADVATNEKSCVARLLVAAGPANDFGTSGDALVGFASPLDLSATVRHWQDGTLPNNGLIFVGFDESLPAEQERECYSRLGDFQLKVLFTE